MLRELAWLELDVEAPDQEQQLMDDEQFDEEVAMAEEGRWAELGLDQLPDNWQTSSIEELRSAVG